MGKQRLFYVDALRGFAILLVIIGHLPLYCYKDVDASPLFSFVTVFHMPLFMMISGCVLNFDTFSLGKRFKVLIPFFFFGILYSSLIIGCSVFGFLGNEAKCGYWFLWAISIFFLFLYIIRLSKMNPVLGMVMTEILFLLLHFFFHRTTIGMTISTDSLWRLWPFFSLGVLKNVWFDWIRQRAKLTFSLCAIAISLALFVAIYFNLFDTYWPGGILRLIMAVPICIMLILLFYDAEMKCKNSSSAIKGCLKRMGSEIGTSTLQIYVLHYFILHYLDLHFFGQYMIDNNMIWLEFIVSPVLAILISYICIYVSKLLHKMKLGIVFGR